MRIGGGGRILMNDSVHRGFHRECCGRRRNKNCLFAAEGSADKATDGARNAFSSSRKKTVLTENFASNTVFRLISKNEIRRIMKGTEFRRQHSNSVRLEKFNTSGQSLRLSGNARRFKNVVR